VQWSAHIDWTYSGLGYVVEINRATRATAYKVMWQVDIDSNDGYRGTWYHYEDFKDGIIVKL